MTSERPRAIVAGHGAFAEGILSAVEQIAGRGDCLVAVSNADLAPGDIETKLRTLLDATGAQVIFTDLPAGSCTIAARRIQRDHPGLVLVTGAALPTILSFACGGDIVKAVEQGRAAMMVVEAKRDA
jgi:mannose/fructose-specific phosphotransferase system component IIA